MNTVVDNIFKKIKWDKSKFIIVPLLTILVLYIIFNDMIMPMYTRHGESANVPDLVEMTYEGARILLQQNNLKIVEKAKKFDDRFRAGIVISQNPLPGSKVKLGRRIYVIVSKGEPTIEMPQLIGNSEKNAIFEIERLGLNIRYKTYEYSEHFHDGVVINQSIPIGKEIKLGETVDLEISLGRKPDKFIVPDLIGRSLKDAQNEIQQAGLTLGNVSYQVENSLLPETVIAQSKDAGAEVSQGDPINLLISKLGSSSKDNIE